MTYRVIVLGLQRGPTPGNGADVLPRPDTLAAENVSWQHRVGDLHVEVRGSGAPLLVMTSGAHRVSEPRVAGLIGAGTVQRADARSVRAWTGQAIGGVGPVGHPAPIRTLVDVWLEPYDVVWAAAGHPHTVFPTSFAELVRITSGTPAEVG